MRRGTALFLFIFIFLFPLSARSEIREGSFEVSPFIGGFFYEDEENLKDRPVLGVRLGYNFTKNFGIEGTLEHVNTRVDRSGARNTPDSPPFFTPDDGVKNTLYHIDAIYHFMPERKFNPFVVAGIGESHFNASSTGNTDRFLIDFGVGAKYWMTGNTALRADVRDIVTVDRTFHNIEATVGIVFAFGGKAKPAPVAKPEPRPEPKPEPRPEPKPEPRVEARPEPPKPEPKPEPEPAPMVQEKKIILEDVHFEFDKATLTKEAREILKRDTQVLKENPGVRVRIEGHACAHGPEDYNLRLSERRANAVKEFLIKDGGIEAERLSTIAYGETRLAMPEIPTPKNKNSKEAKANRRVHFEVIAK